MVAPHERSRGRKDQPRITLPQLRRSSNKCYKRNASLETTNSEFLQGISNRQQCSKELITTSRFVDLGDPVVPAFDEERLTGKAQVFRARSLSASRHLG